MVLYESKFGNTEKIAQSINQAIGGEIYNVAEFRPEMLDDVDLLIVGSPIHGWQPSSETVQFLNHLETGSLKGKYVAAFDTGFKNIFSGNAASRIIRKLERAGGKQLVPTQKFVVVQSEGPLASGEVDRAGSWALGLRVELEEVTHTMSH